MAEKKELNKEILPPGAERAAPLPTRAAMAVREKPDSFTAPPLPKALTRDLSEKEIRRRYAPPRTLGAPKEVQMAQDAALNDNGVYSLLRHTFCTVKSTLYPQFLGYGVLSGLMQNQIIRSGIEMIADEMTRRWIKLVRRGEIKTDADGGGKKSFEELVMAEIEEIDGEDSREKADRVLQTVEQELQRFGVRKMFRDAFALTGYMGGCLIYIDTLGDDATTDELISPLILDPDVFPAGALRGFRIIEPHNISPGFYESGNPLSKNYFKPQTWWIQGREVHASRLLYFANNKPSTMLLPAYNFFGIPTAQLVLDSVAHFTQSREATAAALKKYSLTVLKTNLADIGQAGFWGDIQNRVAFFANWRDNDGVEIIDMETEDINTVVSPIAGMTDVVRQSMDVVAAMFNEPAVKLWGITPSGLNSTGEADLTNHYDNIMSTQEAVFREPLMRVIRILQWNSLQQIDESIEINFEPLGVMNEATLSQMRTAEASRDNTYVNIGVLSPEEVRARLAADPDSGYSNIDVSKTPEPQHGEEGSGKQETVTAEDAKKSGNIDEGGWITYHGHKINVDVRCFTYADDGTLLLPKKIYARAMSVINDRLLPLGDGLNGSVQKVQDSDFVYTVEVIGPGEYKVMDLKDIDTDKHVRDIWEELVNEAKKHRR